MSAAQVTVKVWVEVEVRVSLVGVRRYGYLESLHKVCRYVQHLLALAACHRADEPRQQLPSQLHALPHACLWLEHQSGLVQMLLQNM